MVEVREGHLGLHIYAEQRFERGDFILRSRGEVMPHRTRHTIQTDFDTHVDFPTPLRLINHSCDPNCGLLLPRGSDTIELYALRAIEPGEELFTDYCTFENEIHFLTGPCLCGTAICRGRITGFKDLPPERIEALNPYIAEYLQPVAAIHQAG